MAAVSFVELPSANKESRRGSRALRRLFHWLRGFMELPPLSPGAHLRKLRRAAVYAGVLVYLIVKHAGHVFGLDGWVENREFMKQHPGLKPLVA